MAKRTSFRARIVAIAGAALLHASCDGWPEAADSGDRGAQGRPSKGGVLRLVQEGPRTLDPVFVDSVYEGLPVHQIFDGLVALDPSLNTIPSLAATWTIADQREYVFHLRPGVLFHDGTPLTSEDVAFTIRRVLSPPHGRQSLATPYLLVVEGARDFCAGRSRKLPGVSTPDPLTVRIRLERPYPTFLGVLAMDALRIVPRRVVERIGDAEFGRRPVGTGPFRLARWDQGLVRLEAYPAHFAGPPHLDAIEIHVPGPDEPEGGIARFNEGHADLIEAPSAQLERLASSPGVKILRYPELSLNFLGLDTGYPHLEDERVRRAIAHAINRERIASQHPTIRRLATGILPPGLPGYSPRPKTLPYDPDRARALLAEAGHPAGARLPPLAVYTANRSAAAQQLLASLSEDLRAVGVRVEVQIVSWPEFSRRLETHSAPAFLLGWIADLTDPDAFLRSLFEPGAAANYFNCRDPQVSALLDRGARELHPVERAKIYRAVEERILAHAPIVPLYYNVRALAVRGAVRDLEPSPLGLSAVDFREVWLARGEAS